MVRGQWLSRDRLQAMLASLNLNRRRLNLVSRRIETKLRLREGVVANTKHTKTRTHEEGSS
jgi:hypothetical protein